MKPCKNNPSIFVPDDVFEGEDGHPQCCFFELSQSSPDPEETFFGIKYCLMSNTENAAEVCNGDYICCPIRKLFGVKALNYPAETVEIKESEYDDGMPF